MKDKQRNARSVYTAQFYRQNRGAFLVTVIATVLIASLNHWISWVIQQMIDHVSGVAGSLSLRALAWNVAGIVLGILFLDAVRYAAKPRFMQRAMTQYKDFAFKKLTRKSISAFQAEGTANYISALSNDAATVESGYLEMQFDFLSNLILLVGALAMMLFYDPVMTAVACGFFVLPVLVSYFTGNRVGKIEKTISEKNGQLTATLKDCLSGFSVIKSFKAEAAVFGLFARSNAAVERAKCQKRKLLSVIGALAGAAGIVAQLGTFLVGAWLAQRGLGITPGILVVFINLTGLALGAIRALPEQLAARKAAAALIDKLAASLENNVRDEGTAISNRLETGIVLDHVSFGYEAECEVLHDITAHFEAGRSYAIAGASGSGKSTLLHLLMAGHGTYTGEITYDGQEAKTISCESLYELVSMIQQNVFIFNASIRDNITMFREFPEEEVSRAMELAGLSALIAGRGEDYLCGENGSGLSGGEKQRIAIARALLRRSQVLLVDEATAALDAATAYQVSDAILHLDGMTRIVVTHSLDEALLRRYDCILTLKNGRVAESGDFDTLMERQGYFYSLFTVSQ